MALVKVGTTALRGPDGDFLPAVQLYADIPEAKIQPSGLTKTDEQACDMFLKLCADKIKHYIDNCKAAGIEVNIND